MIGSSCKSIHLIDKIPEDTYQISAKQYAKLSQDTQQPVGARTIKIGVEQTDSLLKISPEQTQLKPIDIKLNQVDQIKMYRYTFDIDVLTVPFKIRPSVSGFPQQLDANFDAALYIGRRRDNYTIEKATSKRASKPRITGAGYGYGGFVGIGSVTMNPFVTQQTINYEYNGFVLNGGIAGIYDARRFNIGLAIGADFLMDKNKNNWIYQGKPWIGVLFGINLN
jgi:hypothetical protein